jgi:hypothetical protein
MTQEEPTPDAQPPEPVTTDSLLTSHATVADLEASYVTVDELETEVN